MERSIQVVLFLFTKVLTDDQDLLGSLSVGEVLFELSVVWGVETYGADKYCCTCVREVLHSFVPVDRPDLSFYLFGVVQ